MRQTKREVAEGIFRMKLVIGLVFFGALLAAIGYVKYMMFVLEMQDIDLPTLLRWGLILIDDRYFLFTTAGGGVAGVALAWLFVRSKRETGDGQQERPGMRQP